MLRKIINPKTNTTEYALVSTSNGQVLKYFGTKKPSEQEIDKEERRVNYYKHLKGKNNEK